MKDLPRVYVNPVEKEFNNYQKECMSKKDTRFSDNRNLSMKIKDIFNARNYIYRQKVKLKLVDGIYEKTIVGKTTNSLLTLNGEKIKISDILDLELI